MATSSSSTQAVPVVRVQLSLFVLGSAAGGLAGALLGHWTGSLGTEAFGLQLAIGIFLVLLIGGADSLWGPLVGAAVFVALPELLESLQEYQTVVYGGVLLVVVIAFPHGIVGGLRRGRAALTRLRRRPAGPTGAADDVGPVAGATEPELAEGPDRADG